MVFLWFLNKISHIFCDIYGKEKKISSHINKHLKEFLFLKLIFMWVCEVTTGLEVIVVSFIFRIDFKITFILIHKCKSEE
jgi:hypothetical protein